LRFIQTFLRKFLTITDTSSFHSNFSLKPCNEGCKLNRFQGCSISRHCKLGNRVIRPCYCFFNKGKSLFDIESYNDEIITIG